MSGKIKSRLLTALTLGFVFCSWATLFAESFQDNHDDGLLYGWTQTGARSWSEQNGHATPENQSGSNGFLIKDGEIEANGVLSVNISSDQWNGHWGGVVFRWSSPDDFYFVAVQPGNQYSNFIRFCRNSTDAYDGVVIAENFAAGTTFNLKIEMDGSEFSFYIDDEFMGTITDTQHPDGQIGYAYTSEWTDYIDFNSIEWEEENATRKFLIITAAGLYADTPVKAAVDQYAASIASQGWQGTILTVSPRSVDNPMFQWSDEVSLKAKIRDYYDIGYEGFVFIGSSDEIPLVKWHTTEKDSWYDPTDLYYADMQDWADIDNDGVYESFHATDQKFSNGDYIPDYSKPASSVNEYYQADMFFGRIDAGPLSTDKNAERAYVLSYLNKILLYRAEGSRLTPEQQRRACAIVDDDWAGNCQAQMLAEAVPNVHIICDLERSNEAVHIEHLEAGYKFYMQLAHSGQNNTGFNEWENGLAKARDSSFTLQTLENVETRINYINLFSCSACDFEKPNFGAAYIFREEHTYNVTGSTGRWGPWLDSTYWKNIAGDMPIGEAYMDYFNRLNDSIPLNQKDRNLPKAILCGDPLLTYGAECDNKAPMVTTDLRRVEASQNQMKILNFGYTDSEGDEIVLSMDESEFPEGAGFSQSSFIWIPQEQWRGQEVPLTIIATDPVHNNSYTEQFSIYVSHFKDPQFESMNGWPTLGNPVFGMGNIETPFKVSETRYIQTDDSWGGISQTVMVEQYRNYRFSLSLANKLRRNEDSVFIAIPECGVHFPILQEQNENELRNVDVFFSSGNHTQITVQIVAGSSETNTSGKLYIAGARLLECGDLIAGDVNFSGSVHADDAQLLQLYLDGSKSMTQIQRDAGDVSNDGCISVHDRQLILFGSVGLITLPYTLVVGDVNEDGIVNGADHLMVANHVFNIDTLGPIPKNAADVNGDDAIDMNDVNLIQDYINGIIGEFPFTRK